MKLLQRNRGKGEERVGMIRWRKIPVGKKYAKQKNWRGSGQRQLGNMNTQKNSKVGRKRRLGKRKTSTGKRP